MKRISAWVCFLVCAVLWTGCYSVRPSSGGGQTKFDGSQEINPADVALPPRYRIEAVAQGLTFPTGATFDNEGNLYVVESGYAYGELWTTPAVVAHRAGRANY